MLGSDPSPRWRVRALICSPTRANLGTAGGLGLPWLIGRVQERARLYRAGFWVPRNEPLSAGCNLLIPYCQQLDQLFVNVVCIQFRGITSEVNDIAVSELVLFVELT